MADSKRSEQQAAWSILFRTGKGASDCFAIYNMHWVEHIFALPTLTSKGNGIWQHRQRSVLKEPLLLDNQHDIQVEDRTVMILISQQVG